MEHGAFDISALRAFVKDRQRDLDYRIFMEEQTRALIRSLGIQLVGWRDVAAQLPKLQVH